MNWAGGAAVLLLGVGCVAAVAFLDEGRKAWPSYGRLGWLLLLTTLCAFSAAGLAEGQLP